MKKWIIIAWLLSFSVMANDMITKIIPLSYINSQETINTLKPVLSPQESITAAGNDKILVNVQGDTLTKIREILHQLDVPPVTFQITIHQDDENWLNSLDESTTTYSSKTLQTSDTQSVSVLNNTWAFINTGSNVPVISSVQGGFWGPGVSYDRMQVDKGFLINPVLQGSKVNIKIKRTNQQQDLVNSQNINGQNIDTTMLIPLDNWAKLGSTSQNDLDTATNQNNYNAGNKFATKGTLYIRVKKMR